MVKQYFSRSVSRRMASEYPVADPFGGPAYGEYRDIGSALGSVAGFLGGPTGKVITSIAAPVIGGLLGNEAADKQADAAKDAARASADAAARQADIQRQMYEQTRADQTPWRETGAGALNRLAMLMGVTPSSGGSGTQGASVYTPNDLLVGPGMEANRELYASDPAYRQAYDSLAGQIAYVTANGTLADARRYEKYAPGIAAAMRKAIDTGELNQRMSTIAEQRSAATGDPTQSADFGRLARDFSMADFEADPGYEFRQREGMQALDRGAAARGGLLSGSAIKAAQRFGQDLASQEYGNAFNRYQSNQTNQFNRLASLAGVGQTANNALQQAGGQFANAMTGISQANAANQGNALLAAGNARASGYAGIGNAIGGALANWQPQQASGYQVPAGYNLGSGALGNTAAMNQGYQPLDYGTYNSMGGFYD